MPHISSLCHFFPLPCPELDSLTNMFPHYRSQRSRRVQETVEIRRGDRSRTPVRIVREEVRPTTERIVVEEHRETRREAAAASSVASSDEVVVIEEHSPPPRRTHSKRDSREYSSRRESGYRTVDPLAFGGTVGGRSERRSRR